MAQTKWQRQESQQKQQEKFRKNNKKRTYRGKSVSEWKKKSRKKRNTQSLTTKHLTNKSIHNSIVWHILSQNAQFLRVMWSTQINEKQPKK